MRRRRGRAGPAVRGGGAAPGSVTEAAVGRLEGVTEVVVELGTVDFDTSLSSSVCDTATLASADFSG